ncbi:hypothetical protein ACL03H_17450 [Saccharopolyspora sp. MS10]|uniref:hypothetical protein n=1 Tax=Saccharopolyspora sp. MS10 TaxID=3385973 RepID=UPI0039A12B16
MPPRIQARTTKPLPPYRAVLAVDAKDFSSAPSAHQEALSADVPELLRAASEQSGHSRLWEAKVLGSATGDGYFFAVDAADAPFLVDPFLAELDDVLSEHDEVVRARDRRLKLRLRVSVHLGPIPDSGLSTAMNETHRLLDSEPVREALAGTDPEVTYVAAILSERVFTDVIEGGYVKLCASQLAKRAVRVKRFASTGYLYVPNGSPAPVAEGVSRIDPERLAERQRAEEPAERPAVHNEFSGTSSGSVLQIGHARDVRGLGGTR